MDYTVNTKQNSLHKQNNRSEKEVSYKKQESIIMRFRNKRWEINRSSRHWQLASENGKDKQEQDDVERRVAETGDAMRIRSSFPK